MRYFWNMGAGNTFGRLLKLTTFGESHGAGIGGVLDGCPANLELDLAKIQHELNRRKPGQSKIVTQRKEADEFQILSGVFEGKTTGTPIGFFIPNGNQKSHDYDHIKSAYRPSHADYTYDKKYGTRDYRGGGRSSARETAARVFAGAIAQQVLEKEGITIAGFVSQVGAIKMNDFPTDLSKELVDQNDVRCPDAKVAQQMEERIMEVRKQGDTIGGVVSCVIKGVPVGLGEPVFEKYSANLGHAMLGVNACKGFEIGSGFQGVEMLGSEHNDAFIPGEEIGFESNYSGGVQGGISNGNDVSFRCAFKPVATLIQDQQSVNDKGEAITFHGKGRHDPCVVPRAVPIIESMAALVTLDHLLMFKAYKGFTK